MSFNLYSTLGLYPHPPLQKKYTLLAKSQIYINMTNLMIKRAESPWVTSFLTMSNTFRTHESNTLRKKSKITPNVKNWEELQLTNLKDLG